MIPFFPSLRPAIANHLWFDADESCDDDAEVQALESDHQAWLNKITQIGADLNPIGKILNENIDNIDSEDEDVANDESDDSDNSDEDDDEMEDINNAARNNINDRLSIDPPFVGNEDDIQANETI